MEAIEVLLAKDPNNPLFRDQRAKILWNMGRATDALKERHDLVVEYPHAASLWAVYGDALRGHGDREECIAAYRQALKLDASMADVYLRISDLKTYAFSPEELAAMERLLRKSDLSAEARTHLHFALGRGHGQQK